MNEFNISLKLITYEIIKAMSGHGSSALDVGGFDKKSEYEMKEKIEESCANTPGGLLIIDEAQNICEFNGGNHRLHGLNIINGLRYYCDRKLFGIALLSNGEVYKRTKLSKNSTQLSSRIWTVKIDGLTENDIDLIMSAWGVTGKQERAKSIELGTGKGGLRVLTDAYRRARRNYGEITYDTMIHALRG